MSSRPHFLNVAIRDRAPRRLIAVDGTRLVAREVEFAITSKARRRGLLGRDSLSQGAALVIAPSGGVHTFGMRFPIDVIFTTRDGRVLKIRADMPPARISVCLRAFAVVEVPAGTALAAQLRVGDQLELRTT